MSAISPILLGIFSFIGLFLVTRLDAPSQLKNEGPVILISGIPVSTYRTLNLIPGSGVVPSCTQNADLQRTDCTLAFNSAVIPTHDQIHDNENYCKSTNGTTAYSCSLANKALVAYKEGQSFLLNPDAPCIPSCTLSINTIPAVSIKNEDGSNPNTSIRWKWVTFDGAVFRVR